MKKRIYFASDAHLGFPNRLAGRDRELRFAAWLDSISNDVEELYLLGDIFDFWFEYKHVVPRGFTRIIGRLAQFTDRGIPVHFFTGNHDLWVRDYLVSEAGVILHRKPYTTQLHGKTFYMAHGDGLGKGDVGYKMLKWFFTNRILHWLFSRLHPNFAVGLAHAWSNKSRYAKGVVADTLNPEKDILLNYARETELKQHFDFHVFGHRHRPVNIEIGDKKAQFINLGDWLTHFSYGVFDGNEFRLEFFNPERESLG